MQCNGAIMLVIFIHRFYSSQACFVLRETSILVLTTGANFELKLYRGIYFAKYYGGGGGEDGCWGKKLKRREKGKRKKEEKRLENGLKTHL